MASAARGKKWPYLKFRYGIEIGETVYVIGHPFGFQLSVTHGIISATEPVNRNDFQHFYQTDAAINTGNSGGALVDANGFIVGMNSELYNPVQLPIFTGVGFALKSEMLSLWLEQFKTTGNIDTGELGIKGTLNPLTPHAGGLVVDTVGYLDKPSAAAKAGIQPGDVIVAFNGEALVPSEEIEDSNAYAARHLDALLAMTAPGEIVTLTVVRGIETLTLKVTLDMRRDGLIPKEE